MEVSEGETILERDNGPDHLPVSLYSCGDCRIPFWVENPGGHPRYCPWCGIKFDLASRNGEPVVFKPRRVQ